MPVKLFQSIEKEGKMWSQKKSDAKPLKEIQRKL